MFQGEVNINISTMKFSTQSFQPKASTLEFPDFSTTWSWIVRSWKLGHEKPRDEISCIPKLRFSSSKKGNFLSKFVQTQIAEEKYGFLILIPNF